MVDISEDSARQSALNAEASTMPWHRSTRSMGNGNCVETAQLSDGRLAVRDSKDRRGPVLLFTHSEWRAFVEGIKDGEFEIF